VLVRASGGGRVAESDGGRMPSVVAHSYLLNAGSGKRGALKERAAGKGLLLDLPLR